MNSKLKAVKAAQAQAIQRSILRKLAEPRKSLRTRKLLVA